MFVGVFASFRGNHYWRESARGSVGYPSQRPVNWRNFKHLPRFISGRETIINCEDPLMSMIIYRAHDDDEWNYGVLQTTNPRTDG